MIAFIYDSETTGLNPEVDRIIQHGILVYDLDLDKIIDARTWLCWTREFPNVAESGKTHGFTLAGLIRHAVHPLRAINDIEGLYYKYKPVCFIAHNGCKFDKNILRAERARGCSEPHQVDEVPMMMLPWLDTLAHATYPGCPNKALITIAAFHGYINPFAHEALADCYTLAHIIARKPTLILEMAKVAASTMSVIFANIPPGVNKANNDMVKSKGFRFQDWDDHHYEKSWIKVIRREDYPTFSEECLATGFQTNIIKDIPPPDANVELLVKLNALYEKKWID